MRSSTRPIVRRAIGAVLLVMACWLLATGALWFGQESLLFRPEVLPTSTVLAREPDVHERTVAVPGARLCVLELRLPAPKGVVLFLHGNGGSLRTWFVNVDFYRRANFDLVMPDYRGYGKSSGRVESEAQLHADVAAVWKDVAERYRGKRVVIYGRSLGTGLAAALAADIDPDLTILVSPYSSMLDLARLHYPWAPGFLLRYPLRTDLTIGRIRSPILLVHGDRDELVPMSQSRRLSALATNATLVAIAGAGHNDLQSYPAYREAVSRALATLP